MSRRMWARRMIRAGWLLAPVMAFPGKIVNFIFSSITRFLLISFCVAVVYGLVSAISHNRRVNTAATPEEITAVLKGNIPRINWCLNDYLPRLSAELKRPLLVKDLDNSVEACVDVQEKHDKMTAQRAAMPALKK